MSDDTRTASAFASSWNNLPSGSVYTWDQFEEWVAPLKEVDFKDRTVLELGCGNASLLSHAAKWNPASLTGVDLGDSVLSAKQNMALTGFSRFDILKSDLTEYRSTGYDLVYCIGVLHHLQNPKKGLDSVLVNVKSGGKFHCWVYAKEGNWLIINIVDPIRKVASKLPWWFTKYLLATPLVLPYYLYAKFISYFCKSRFFGRLPMYDYSMWISKRDFSFFRHVAFDQLVTPQTQYIEKSTIEQWLRSYRNIIPGSTYIIFRNGNSWKFGGKVL